MKNSKDKSIIKLIIIFVLYYVITKYMPNLISGGGKILNLFIKDLVIIIVFCLLYYKDVKKDWGRFKRSDHKIKVLVWAAVIYFSIVVINVLIRNFFPNIANNYLNKNPLYIPLDYYSASPIYSLFRAVIYSVIAESILFSLSFRKVFNNNVTFIIVSSLVYALLPFILVKFSINVLIGAFFISFIPRCIYNIVYVKNDNNIVLYMFIIALLNAVIIFLQLTNLTGVIKIPI